MLMINTAKQLLTDSQRIF